MSNKNSIEWLVDQINVARKLCDDPNMEMDIWHTLDVLIKKGEQAKEMHKQEIERAYYEGIVIVMSKPDDDMLQLSQQYYNETFGE